MGELNTKMTALADQVRALNGSDNSLGITDMGSAIASANQTIDNQADLIAELKKKVNNLPDNDDDKWLLRENTSYTNNSATSVGYGAICYHQKLENINLPNVTTIAVMGFAYCPKLTEINLPKLNTTNNYAFRNCTSIASVYLPEATKLPYAFVECSALTEVNLPKLQQTRGTFYKCTGLTSVTLPTTCTYIDISSFNGCTNLTSLTLLSPTRANMANVNALTGTPIANGTGYVYVPDDLVAVYKSSTNWSTYANQIKGISEAG